MKPLHLSIGLAVLYVVLFWWINYAYNLLLVPPTQDTIIARDAGAAFVLPLLTGFLIFGNVIVVRTGSLALAKILSVKFPNKRHRMGQFITQRIIQRQRRYGFIVAGVALTGAASYILGTGVISADADHPYRWILILQALPVWLSILSCCLSVASVYVLLHKTLMNMKQLSLFEVEKLSPVGDVLIVIFFVFSTSVGIYSLNAFFVDMPAIDIVLMFAGVCIMLLCLVMPLHLMRTSLSLRKSQLLKLLNSRLHNNVNQTEGHVLKRRLVDDDGRLQYVSDLLLIRKEVNALRPVPISQPTALKLLLLLFVPVMSWVGAGTVSMLLKFIQEGGV